MRGSNNFFFANAEQCPRCGTLAETQNAITSEAGARTLGGNTPQATIAFEVFQRAAVAALLNVKVDRQQAWRFEEAVERKGQSAVKKEAAKISPRVSSAVDTALQTPDPNRALQFLSEVTKLAAIAGTGLFTTLAGINEGLDLIERLNDGKPTSEIIRELSRDKPDGDRDAKADSITDGRDNQELEDEREERGGGEVSRGEQPLPPLTDV